MASVTVAAVPHQLPPFHLSPVPRIRPPRMLPGTPSPNSKPQPPGEVPKGEVWVQGKWRNQASNAAKSHQQLLSQRVKRALKHHTHGMDIYAYKHHRSSQVVYSLTRNMESGQIMPQLVFHGKKTVPAALRRDVWRPYFAIHFPKTRAGAKAGLTAYQRLREFSLRRQLSPPDNFLIATQADVEKMKKEKGSPVDIRERRLNRNLRLPMIGQRLPKKLRARKLMDQRATSVADVAFVLKLARFSLRRLEKELLISEEEKDSKRFKLLGQKGRKRLKTIKSELKEKQKEIVARQEVPETVLVSQGKVPLDSYTAKQLSIEYDGEVASSNRVINMADLEAAKNSTEANPYDIQVLWADIRDGTYAESWPDGVFHGELEPVVLSKREVQVIRQQQTVDQDGVLIERQFAHGTRVTGSSPHIIGREKATDYMTFQQLLQEQDNARRGVREAEVAQSEEGGQSLATARTRHVKAVDAFEVLITEPTFVKLATKEADGEHLSPPERGRLAKFRETQSRLLKELAPLRRLEMKHQELAEQLDRLEYWELLSEEDRGNRLQALVRQTGVTEIKMKEVEAEVVNLYQDLALKLRRLPDNLANTLETKSLLHQIEREEKQLEKGNSPVSLIERIGRTKSYLHECYVQLKKAADTAPTNNGDIPELTSQTTQELEIVEDVQGSIQNCLDELTESHAQLKELKRNPRAAFTPLAPYMRYQEEKERIESAIAEKKQDIGEMKVNVPKEGGSDTVATSSTASTSATEQSQALSALEAALVQDTARLEALSSQALDDFVHSDYDISGLLPKSYRNAEYWSAMETESKEERIAREEAEMKAIKVERGERRRLDEEEEERRRGKEQEGKGWFRRIGERVGLVKR